MFKTKGRQEKKDMKKGTKEGRKRDGGREKERRKERKEGRKKEENKQFYEMKTHKGGKWQNILDKCIKAVPHTDLTGFSSWAHRKATLASLPGSPVSAY